MLIRSGAMFAVLLLVPEPSLAQPRFEFFEPVNPPRPVQVMVHRGLSKVAPENTRAAIEMAVQDYCEWVEIDLRLTKDGQHVVIHNDTVDATTDGKGRVSEMTLSELQQLDAGAWFARRFAQSRLMSLPEVLALAKGKVNLYLDCKQVDPKRLVDEIIAAKMESQVIVYGQSTLLSQVRDLSHGSLPGMTKYRGNIPLDSFVKEVAPAAVEIDADEVTAELCQKFHAAGIKVQAKVLGAEWDQPSVWGRVIDAGVDWLQTDDPAGILFFNARRRFPSFGVMIAFHRGASRYAPENTIPAIREAARLGADFAEIDIQTTKDGKTVLMHDGTVNRTTTAQGPVREFLFDDVLALNAGGWFGKPFQQTCVPSFDAGLQEFGPQMGAYLDAKNVSPTALIAAIQKYDLWNRHVVFQSAQYCSQLKMLDANVRTMPPLKRPEDLDAVAGTKPYALDTAWSILSAELIEDCHRRGIKVFSDALGRNETVEQYRKAMSWGIDCIQTDHPLRVLRAIELQLSTK